MKATLTFDLPEEKQEFNMFSKANEYYCLLTDIDSYCRSIIKYEENLNSDLEKHLITIRQMIGDLDA